MNQGVHKISPAVRLTVAYVAIIMAVSVSFSVALYKVSTEQIDTSLHRQYARFHRLTSKFDFQGPPPPSRIQDELAAGSNRLRIELIYFNLVILTFGSAASYWMARRTLHPIELALEAQSRFAADASHELRTPLAAMQSEIEVALRDPKFNTSEAKMLLSSNLEEIAKLGALSDGLLRLASNDGADLQRSEVVLGAVIDTAIKKVGPLAKTKKITIDNQVRNISLLGDLHSLTELAVILLDNAIKYSPSGSMVRLTARKLGRQAELKVSDEGAGIKSSDIPRIFNRFYRSDTARSKNNGNGYGLGLSIAKKIVEAHGGMISVSSKPDKGTTFIIRMPLVKSADNLKDL